MKKHPIIVIKLGTSSIVDEKTHQPLLSILAVIVETSVKLRKDGYRVVIVSSGAIGVALQKMGLPRRPKHLPQVQALAAIGQCRLIGLWDQLFDRLGQPVAQILLTRNDIADRTQYRNAQNTFFELLNMGVIPIVNENDTLSVSEIIDKFGDNDTLSAITAGMVQADYLFLMTDVDCLYDKNPRIHPDAKPIEVVENISDLEADVSSAGSPLGTGGMSTKIVAARLATAAGVTTIVTRSSKPGNISGIVNYIEARKAVKRASVTASQQTNGNSANPEIGATNVTSSTSLSSEKTTIQGSDPIPPPLHTQFLPSSIPIRDRHFWILHGLQPHGTLYVDHGAAHALAKKAGLLAVGIVDVIGDFAQQECVRLVEVTKQQSANQSQIQAQSDGPVDSSSPWVLVPSRAAGSSNPSNNNSTKTPPSTGSVTPVTMSNVQTPSFRDANCHEIGRALVNYSATEIKRIKGLRSTEIAVVLGYAHSEYVALRENVAISAMLPTRPTTPTTIPPAATTGRGFSDDIETCAGQENMLQQKFAK